MRSAIAIGLSVVAAGLAGCAAFGGGSARRSSTGASTGTAAKVAQAERTHEYPAGPPPPQTTSAATSAAATAVRRFSTGYINWNATTVTRRMQALALASVGQARAAMALAAAQTRNDYELRHGGIANRGVVGHMAGLPPWVIVFALFPTA